MTIEQLYPNPSLFPLDFQAGKSCIRQDWGSLCLWCTLTYLAYNSSNTGISGGLVSKESACNVGEQGTIPELGRSPGERHGNPLQYSCLGDSMERGAWQTAVHEIPRELDKTYYFTLDNIHVSMLFSWNISPSPSPTESKSLFCTSVSLFLFCI